MTSTNSSMGSPRYMAPEQMRSARDIDARADVWAVGTTLYEMLTCIAPFDGDTLPQICASILQDAPKPISARRADVPPGLVAVVERCLGKTPDERYADIAEVAEALAPFGPQPASAESASRARRLVGGAARRGSAPSDPRLAPAPVSVAATRPAETAGSWTGAPGVPAVPGKRSALSVVILACLGLAAIIGGATFVYARGLRSAPVAAGVVPSGDRGAPPPPPPASASVAAPSPSLLPSATATSTSPAPVASVRPTPAAPSPAPHEPKPARQAEAKPVAKPASTPAAPSPAPAPKPPSGGLWDDRK